MIQADPTKFYHVFTCGEFPAFDWEKGEWGKMEIKSEWGKSVSENYDSSLHKAPLWIGHPFSGAPAEGWVANSNFEGKKLYNSFDYIDENFIKAVRDKKYQYVSCEFGKVMGVEGDYQVALGATNLPRVSGQKPLEFEGMNYSMAQGHSVYCPISEPFILDITKDFSASSTKYFFQNHNNNSMNELIKKLAQAFSIDLNLYNSDQAVITKATEMFSALENDNKSLSDKVTALDEQRIKFAIDQAIEEKRILPAEKETYESLLKGNFEPARKALFSRPVNPASGAGQIPSGGSAVEDPTNAVDKFTNEDGTKLTFDQFTEKVKKDPKFADQFSDDELSSLPGIDSYYKK